jgi:hypothetical protein
MPSRTSEIWGDRFVPGSYHTDGVRLLRVVDVEGGGRLRAIEDCRTLHVIVVPVVTLHACELRSVRPALPQRANVQPPARQLAAAAS